MKEIWETIPGFENYSISSHGRVYSHKRDIILKPYFDGWGYLIVELRNRRGGFTKRIHRLVAETFIPNVQDKLEVNHIDGDKMNNRVDNLEWVTRSENARHAFATGLNVRSSYDAGRPKRTVTILETGKVFDSVVDCATYLGCTSSYVVQCLQNPSRTCKGYHLASL